MSYSIIFETKIVKLSDGNIIHFDRRGCNNDTAGRNKWDTDVTLYSIDEFIKKANHYKEKSFPYNQNEYGDWILKISGKPATMYDYGEHLLRMLKRAENYADFVSKRYVGVKQCSGIELLKPEQKTMTLDEFEDYYYNNKYNSNGLSWRRIMNIPDIYNEKEIENLIKNGAALEFYIGKKKG